MTEQTSIIPEWHVFEHQYILGGIPHIFVVRPDPQVAVFVDERAARLGARFVPTPNSSWSSANSLENIHIGDVIHEGLRFVEIWTDVRDLYPNFYLLVSEVTVAVVDGADPVQALTAAVSKWNALLSKPSLLSEESQLGLFGELWLLDRLIGCLGPSAIEAWIGPTGQSHDFRLHSIELEVKTTARETRIHTINGVGQLLPSPGHMLYVLSLKVTDGGSNGKTLTEMVAHIADQLSTSRSAHDRYRDSLAALSYRDKDGPLYIRRRRLRDTVVLIPVADGTPRLTKDVLANIGQKYAPERITKIVYDVDLNGLGFADGSNEFNAVIPPSPSSPGVSL